MASGDHDNDMDVQIYEPMKIDDNNDTTMDAVEDYSRRPARPRPHKDENFVHSAVINNCCPIPVNEVVKGRNVLKLHPSWERLH